MLQEILTPYEKRVYSPNTIIDITLIILIFSKEYAQKKQDNNKQTVPKTKAGL